MQIHTYVWKRSLQGLKPFYEWACFMHCICTLTVTHKLGICRHCYELTCFKRCRLPSCWGIVIQSVSLCNGSNGFLLSCSARLAYKEQQKATTGSLFTEATGCTWFDLYLADIVFGESNAATLSQFVAAEHHYSACPLEGTEFCFVVAASGLDTLVKDTSANFKSF